MDLFKWLKRSLRLGLWPLFQRYVVASKIRYLPPVKFDLVSDYSIHTLLNRKDLVMYEWMLRSLILHAGNNFSIHVHEDGTFTNEDVKYLESKYEGIKIWRRSEADEVMMNVLKGYPRLIQYRKNHFWAIKALDVYELSTSKYMILVDADILFFSNPVELFTNDDRNCWMEDVCYMLGISSELCERSLQVEKLRPMNAGLGRALRQVLDYDLAERFLAIQENPVNDMIFHALFCTKFSSIYLLDGRYMLKFKLGVDDITAKHYVNPIRFWFWEEGVPRVAHNLNMKLHAFLKERL